MAHTGIPTVETEDLSPAASVQIEQRRSARRVLPCRVVATSGTNSRIESATAIGADGAFLVCSPPIEKGAKISFTFALPLQPPANVEVGAVVVRQNADGVGVRFVEISSRNRALLVQYVSHMLADDAVKRLQREFGDVLGGHLLPTGLVDDAREALLRASRNRADACVILARRRFHRFSGKLGPARGNRLEIELRGMEAPEPYAPAYVAFSQSEVQYVFETVFVEPDGQGLAVQIPDRIYSTERRARPRRVSASAHAEIAVAHVPEGWLTVRVLDYDSGGFAIALPALTLVMPGMILPCCRLCDGGRKLGEGEAVVRNVLPIGRGEIRVGLEFARATRPAFEERVRRDLRRPFKETFRAFTRAARARLATLMRPGARRSGRDELEIVRYKTPEKEEIVGIIDRTEGAAKEVDLGVVIAPALGKRKETFGLLARTIVENFEAMGKSAVVLRYDDVRSVGESTNDPGCSEEGKELYHYTLSQVGRDADASLRFLRKLARPRKLALVTVSIGAIPARRFLAQRRFPSIDAWVSLFGCPDAEDIGLQIMGGEDLFAEYRRGDRGTKLIVGFQLEFHRYIKDAIDHGFETLETAMDDLSRIETPITWVVGEHDYWVRRERVRQLLSAPGGGTREIFEVPTGHLVKSGEEALETFKLVAESIAKHALGAPLTARDPDLVRFEVQSKREWDRVRRARPADTVAYWSQHLFGKEGETAGYDIVRTSAMYLQFLEHQHDIAEIGAGMHVCDLGCGTGNFSELAARRAIARGTEIELTCIDLVPEAVERTAAKVEAVLEAAGPAARHLITCRKRPMNVEVSRLKPVHDFVTGEVYGIEALAGAIDGFPEDLPARLRSVYSADLHAILRGRPADAATLREIVPGCSEADIDAILDLSRGARFVRGATVAADLIDPSRGADPANIRYVRLGLAGASRSMRTELPDAAFDRVVASLVVSYIHHPEETIAEVYRSLRPGGIFVVSSLKPNFDFSETHMEMVRRIESLPAESLPAGETRESLLEALRGFSSYVGVLVQLEEQGAFRFLDAATLSRMLREAGFRDIQVFDSLGDPGQAVIARGVKPEG